MFRNAAHDQEMIVNHGYEWNKSVNPAFVTFVQRGIECRRTWHPSTLDSKEQCFSARVVYCDITGRTSLSREEPTEFKHHNAEGSRSRLKNQRPIVSKGKRSNFVSNTNVISFMENCPMLPLGEINIFYYVRGLGYV